MYLFGRLIKNLAVRFSIYLAVWIRPYGQVRKKYLRQPRKIYSRNLPNFTHATYTNPGRGIQNEKPWTCVRNPLEQAIVIVIAIAIVNHFIVSLFSWKLL